MPGFPDKSVRRSQRGRGRTFDLRVWSQPRLFCGRDALGRAPNDNNISRRHRPPSYLSFATIGLGFLRQARACEKRSMHRLLTTKLFEDFWRKSFGLRDRIDGNLRNFDNETELIGNKNERGVPRQLTHGARDRRAQTRYKPLCPPSITSPPPTTRTFILDNIRICV